MAVLWLSYSYVRVSDQSYRQGTTIQLTNESLTVYLNFRVLSSLFFISFSFI